MSVDMDMNMNMNMDMNMRNVLFNKDGVQTLKTNGLHRYEFSYYGYFVLFMHI